MKTDQFASASELRAMSAEGKLFVPPPVETTEAPVQVAEGEEDESEDSCEDDADQNDSDDSESEADSDG